MNRLARLLKPRSIAVIGGSWAAAVVRQTQKMGFTGEVWPVHPKQETVEGLPAFRSVDDLPGAPDAVFIAVNRDATIPIVRALSGAGAGGAICFASGFREAGSDDPSGERLQSDLLEAAGAMPVIGPNCYGLLNYADGVALWPDQHGGRRLAEGARGAAIVTQSSNLAINLTMQARGLPLAFVLTAGNQAQTGLSAIALGLIEDPRVSVLGLHIEGFDSVAGFERLAARARALDKAIVALKVGRSEQARAAAVSHTASLAGADAASDAFLRRLGIGRVHSIPAFLETLKLLHVVGPLAGPNLSSMSCSGGEASIMADAAHGTSLRFPALDAGHRDAVKRTLGPLVSIANPLDYHTFIWNDEAAMSATFSAFVAGGFDLNFLILDFPHAERCDDGDWQASVRAFDTALTRNRGKGAILATLPENMPEHRAAGIMARGIAPLQGIAEALEAAAAAVAIGAARALPIPAPLAAPHAADPAATVVLDEAEAKARLAACGLPVPQGARADNAAGAEAVARSIGFPVAVKALGLAHKSEHDAVRLDLADPLACHEAARDLERLGNGLYVERMVEGGIAELIAGITRDPVFGPVMTLGSGGLLVELLADSRILLLPATRAEIEAALRSLQLFALLDGYRGRARADIAAAVEVLAGIAAFAVENAARIVEMDINPLIVCAEGEGAWIADVLLVLEA